MRKRISDNEKRQYHSSVRHYLPRRAAASRILPVQADARPSACAGGDAGRIAQSVANDILIAAAADGRDGIVAKKQTEL